MMTIIIDMAHTLCYRQWPGQPHGKLLICDRRLYNIDIRHAHAVNLKYNQVGYIFRTRRTSADPSQRYTMHQSETTRNQDPWLDDERNTMQTKHERHDVVDGGMWERVLFYAILQKVIHCRREIFVGSCARFSGRRDIGGCVRVISRWAGCISRSFVTGI